MTRWKATLESTANVSCVVVVEAETEQAAREAAIEMRPMNWEVDSLCEPIDLFAADAKPYAC